MKRLALVLLLSLTACAIPSGVYEIIRTGGSHYTAVAIDTRYLVGLLHGVRLFERVTVRTRHGDLEATVVQIWGDASRFKLDARDGLDVRHGDSGAGVFNEGGMIVGVIEGRLAGE